MASPSYQFSRDLYASGVLITASACDGSALVLFGIQGGTTNRLCHFHGLNDEQKQTSGNTTPFTHASITTAARELAEESLEAVVSARHGYTALTAALTEPPYEPTTAAVTIAPTGTVTGAPAAVTAKPIPTPTPTPPSEGKTTVTATATPAVPTPTPTPSVIVSPKWTTLQVLPPQFMAWCQMYWLWNGEMGPWAQFTVCQRFADRIRQPDLKSCQREVAGLVWVTGAALYRAMTEFKDGQKMSVVGTDGNTYQMRSFCGQWLAAIASMRHLHAPSAALCHWLQHGDTITPTTRSSPLRSLQSL